MPAVPTVFGVDALTVRANCFPHFDQFDATSAPTSVAVAAKINQKAAFLAGHLLNAGVIASTITNSSIAWFVCQNVLELMVAIELSQSMTGVNAESVKAWNTFVTSWIEGLEKNGSAHLGDPTLGDDAGTFGPITHISALGLTVPDAAESSDVVLPFRLSDDL